MQLGFKLKPLFPITEPSQKMFIILKWSNGTKKIIISLLLLRLGPYPWFIRYDLFPKDVWQKDDDNFHLTRYFVKITCKTVAHSSNYDLNWLLHSRGRSRKAVVDLRPQGSCSDSSLHWPDARAWSRQRERRLWGRVKWSSAKHVPCPRQNECLKK